MRYRDICLKHARDLDPAFMQVAAENMAPKLGGHKKNFDRGIIMVVIKNKYLTRLSI